MGNNNKSYTWLLLFIPSFSYYIYRLQQTYFSAIFETIPTTIERNTATSTIFSSSHDMQVVSQNYSQLSGMTWYHDNELGRGYMLLSDLIDNRIWRWEIGGGPITIGKSLHMERSGCRSIYCKKITPQLRFVGGSGALGTLPSLEEENDLVIISEYGEERLILMKNGARVPFVTNVLVKDFVILPPLGDLIIVDELSNHLLRIKEGVSNIPQLTMKESRYLAYESTWTGLQHLPPKEILWDLKHDSDEIVGIVMLDWEHVMVTAKIQDKLVLLKIFIGEVDDDEDDDEEVEILPDGTIHYRPKHKDASHTEADASNSTLPKHISLFQDVSSHLPKSKKIYQIGIPTLDEKNHIFVPVLNYGILVFCTNSGLLLNTLLLPPEETCSQLTFGQDYHLYLACTTKLMRVKIPHLKGKMMEKDLYKKKKVKLN